MWCALVVTAAVSMSCGDDEPSSDPATEDGLKGAAKAAFELLIDGESDEVYGHHCNRCREELTFGEFQGLIILGIRFLQSSGVEVEDLEVQSVEVRNFSQARAEALVVYADKDAPDITLSDDTFEPFVFEEDEWRSDDCDDATSDAE